MNCGADTMILDAESHIPKYAQIAETLRQRIARGMWPHGSRLPGNETLAAEFSVSRVTIRQAVELLTREGILEAQQGRGTFITGGVAQDRWLRVETTLNNMRELKSPRMRDGKVVWKRMRKGVADIARRAEVSEAANERYLEAMAAAENSVPLKTLTESLSRPVVREGQRVRGLNLLGADDARLLAAVGNGKFLLTGLRNKDLQGMLYAAPAESPAEMRRRSGQVTRKLRLLRAHGLIRKVQGTHRYLVTDRGRQVIIALQAAREADVTKLAEAA